LEEQDLDALFEQQRDPDANRMAVFGPADPDNRTAFDRHWAQIRADSSTEVRVIEADGEVAGSVSRWRDESLDAPEVTYWLGRRFWGRGVATAAVRQFLADLPDPVLLGRAAATNAGSIRVLEKCGFVLDRVDRGVTTPDGQTVDEVVLRLDRR
jgi:RimJ/RimL family protein N-acetyltransferase